MKKQNTDSIDQLLSDTFDDYSVPEFRNSWSKIKTEVFKQRFFKFNVYQFNVYYGIVAAGAMITAGILFYDSSAPDRSAPVPVEASEQPSGKTTTDTVFEAVDKQYGAGEMEAEDEIKKDELRQDEVQAIEKASPQDILSKEAVDDRTNVRKPEEQNLIQEDSPKTEKAAVLPFANEDDTTKMLPLVPLQSEEEFFDVVADSLEIDSVQPEKKRVIVIEKPVMKRDTVVKIIRKRRRH